MKQLLLIGLTAALSLSLVSCAKPSGDVSPPQSFPDESSSVTFDTPILVETYSQNSEGASFTVSAQSALPYVHPLWSEVWTENGWLVADGTNLPDELSQVAGQLPELTFNDGLSVHCNAGVELLYLSVYSDSLEPILDRAELSALEELEAGTYIVSFTVKELGSYIESEGIHESFGYDCVYRLTK